MLDHLSASQFLDDSGMARDEAVEVLDGVGRTQRSLQRPGQPRTHEGKRLTEPRMHRGGRAWVLALTRCAVTRARGSPVSGGGRGLTRP